MTNAVSSWKHQRFLEHMTQSVEQAQWGFELLLKRADFIEFFDALRESGLFSPSNNPQPVPTDDGAYVRVPYWAALDYLEACAKTSNESNNASLARKVLAVLREVTAAKQANEGEPDNYHTNWKFAGILGKLPLETVTKDDIDLIPTWLNSKFDRGMVTHALDRGLVQRLLATDSPASWSQACRVLWYCTQMLWIEDDSKDRRHTKPVSIVDDHWLGELINHYSGALGSKARKEAADVFLQRLSELYGEDERAKSSWLFRPAIEDHSQNHKWAGVDNRFVEGFRDVVCAWVDVDPINAASYVELLLSHQLEIVRRIGIHILNSRWSVLNGLYDKLLEGAELFIDGHLHELYQLLRNHFGSLNTDQQDAIFRAIRTIQPSEHWKNPERSLKRTQRNWLSAIAGQGHSSTDSWYGLLQSDQSLGALSEHPDFHAYMQSWWGPGPTPYRGEELVKFASDGSLVQRLNEFENPDSWRGPTEEALVKALEEAVLLAPDVFVTALPGFLKAQRSYQYGIINGFKRLWDLSEDKAARANWSEAWSALVTFFEQLLGDDAFWSEKDIERAGLLPTRGWIPPLISSFLRSGTIADDKAYGTELLPRTWQLVQMLLQRSEMETEADEDAMTQAINSSKGKAIEAFFSHALRICRLADREEGGTHSEEWAVIKPVMDAELAMCRNSNFEFSTICAAYLANIAYINNEWPHENVNRLFDAEFPANFKCAIAGLAFEPATRSINQLLLRQGVFDAALRMDFGEHSARERLIQRIALAYLWGDEPLSSPRFDYLFRGDGAEDLQSVIGFFWSVHNEKLDTNAIERILLFWRRCIEWSKTLPELPVNVLSNLSRLSVYLNEGDSKEINLLEEVAPYVGADYNADEFIDQLLRLASVNPSAVSRSFGKMVETHKPTYDYEEKIAKLIRVLADKGLIEDAIDFTDRLRHLTGMRELFEELTN